MCICIFIAPQIGNAVETREPPRDRECGEGSWLLSITIFHQNDRRLVNVFLMFVCVNVCSHGFLLFFFFFFLSGAVGGGCRRGHAETKGLSSYMCVVVFRGGN